MRQLSQHLASGGVSPLHIVALDSPGPGVPNSRYEISGFNTVYNPAASIPGSPYPARFNSLQLIFQNGARVEDAPANGVTEVALLAAIAHHLTGKQNGADACAEYGVALDLIRSTIEVLQSAEEREDMQRRMNLNRMPVYPSLPFDNTMAMSV